MATRGGQSLALHRMCGAPSEIALSRTDVHRPWRVQVADPHNRHLFYRYPAWPWQTELTSFKNLGCGCRLCTQYDWRKQQRRRERYGWRRDLQRLIAG